MTNEPTKSPATAAPSTSLPGRTPATSSSASESAAPTRYRCSKCGLPCETMSVGSVYPSARAARIYESMCCKAPAYQPRSL